MAITIPQSAKEINQRSQVDIQNRLAESNPFDENNFLNALVNAFSNRNFETYAQIQNAIRELFLDTQSFPFIESTFGSYRNIVPLPAVVATGNVVAEGLVGSPIGLVNLNVPAGNVYKTTISKTISANSISVVSITRIGDNATVTTSGDHSLGSGINVTLSGADQVEYNGTFSVIVLSKTVFSYTVTGTPVTPATGPIIASFNTALIPVESVDFGVAQNQSSGAQLTFTSSIPGVNQIAFVDFDSIAGGTDAESLEDYRKRTLESYRGFRSCFNVDDIIATAKLVPGVTRVFVELPTAAGPIFAGEVRVFFTRDNDPNIIPSGQDVANVKLKLLTILPAHTLIEDLIVQAPTANIVNFSFSALVPNTVALQNEITKNLKAFFEDKTAVGVNIAEIAYQSVIFNTIDPETALKVTSFTLTAPIGDIVIASTEIPVLGTVSFP